MALVQSYYSMLTALLPSGILWQQLQQDDVFIGLMQSMAEELARLHQREDDLLNEADPRTVYEMLPEWEAAYGLPDPCVGDSLTLQQRLDLLYLKVINKGGQSKPFFIALAKALGYDITITEFSPHSVMSGVNQPIYGLAWRYVWLVNAIGQGGVKRYFSVKSGVGEPLFVRDETTLQCMFNRFKPAQTRVLFNFGDT
jgi:uncharacterized protein YmfQ (DUF2313 family)